MRLNFLSSALKLLHELQVHQVELDLQHEQAEQEHRQLADELEDYTELFALAPFGYLTLGQAGEVMAINRAAAECLAGADETSCVGRGIEDLLAPECLSSLRDALGMLRAGGGRQSCAVQSRTCVTPMRAVLSTAPSGGRVMFALVPIGQGAGT